MHSPLLHVTVLRITLSKAGLGSVKALFVFILDHFVTTFSFDHSTTGTCLRKFTSKLLILIHRLNIISKVWISFYIVHEIEVNTLLAIRNLITYFIIPCELRETEFFFLSISFCAILSSLLSSFMRISIDLYLRRDLFSTTLFLNKLTNL